MYEIVFNQSINQFISSHTTDILREFLSHNFVSGLRTLKPVKSKNLF